MTLIRKLAVVIIALTSAPVAMADLINGSFEDGLDGWSSLGLTGTRGVVGPHSPTDGDSQAALQATEFSTIDDEQISDTLGLPRFTVANPFEPGRTFTTTIFEILRQDNMGGVSTCLDPDLDDCLTEGSALIYQSFDVETGQRISFDWNLLGVDCCTADSAYVTLTTPDQIIALLLSDTRSSVFLIDPIFGSVDLLCDAALLDICNNQVRPIDGGATGYNSVSLDIIGSGQATLGFSLINSSGPSPDSGLLIDNVTLSMIPEPGTFALLGIGLFGMIAARRRKNA